MFDQKFIEKWFLPFAGLVIFGVIVFGLYQGWTAPPR
jgi:hypothetical protein